MFICLQAFDFLTTWVFLRAGVAEANPLVRWALSCYSPVAGLVVAKLVAVTLGVAAWRSGRRRLLRRMDFVFTACVLWNVAAILIGR